MSKLVEPIECILVGPPYDLPIEETDEGEVISVPLARNNETAQIALIETKLEITTINTYEVWELSFQISVISIDDTREPFTTQDRNIARQYLTAEARQKVMDVVCESAKSLINSVKPACIYLVAKEGRLPEKAMSKYYMLTGAIQGLGYVMDETGTDYAYRPFWSMKHPEILAPTD